MEGHFDYVMLSRLQFAVTALFHILWPALTIGLSIFLVVVESLWLKTGDRHYYHHARFWAKLLLLNFGIGVVSGIPLEFAFGTNWAPFSHFSGDFFGNILGFEGAMAFMLEAGFLGIMMFGWRRVTPGIHLFATIMVALGASLSAFWIMVANSWMQTPAGVHLEQGRLIVDSYAEAIFNAAAFSGVAHMWFACIETSLLVVGGLSAWYLYRGRHPDFFLKSFRVVVIGIVVAAPAQILLGDLSGHIVAEHQPVKLAAMEAHWRTNPPGEGAPWALMAWPQPERERNAWAVEIPNVLSILTTHSLRGQVRGLSSFPADERPPIRLPFFAFRVMLAIGFAVLLLMIWTAWVWWRGGLGPRRIGAERWLLRAWIGAVPLGYIAVEAGWITREVGRQPWVITGLMRTSDAASTLSSATVATSLIAYMLVYAALLVIFLYFARYWLRKGPDFSLEPPPRRSPSGPQALASER